MRTTRVLIGPLTLCAVLLGCSDDGPTADGGAEAAGDETAAAFCQRLEALEGELDVADGDVPDESQLEGLVVALRELDPPAPIADDFEELLDAYDVLTRVEAGEADAATDLEDQFESFAGAGQRVDEWTQANCARGGDDAAGPEN